MRAAAAAAAAHRVEHTAEVLPAHEEVAVVLPELPQRTRQLGILLPAPILPSSLLRGQGSVAKPKPRSRGAVNSDAVNFSWRSASWYVKLVNHTAV